jgi:Na+/H+ antiporter NhaC
MIGILSSIVIGFLTDSFHILAVGKIIYEGFMSMADVFFVTFLIAGLAAIASKEGGVDYLLKKLSPWAKGKRSAEFVIAACVSIADISILFTAPVAKKLASQFHIARARAASILDVFSCVWQGVIPHGAQILLAGGLCKLSGFDILPYSYYPFLLGIVAILDIMMMGNKKHAH